VPIQGFFAALRMTVCKVGWLGDVVVGFCGARLGFVVGLAKNGRVQVPIQGFFAALRMTVCKGVTVRKGVG